jgi:16S rRNA G966 N2-methylase RsmD
MNSLALLDKAARHLAQCTSLDEAKTIRDKAIALEVYAKQAKQSAEMERQCAVIRLRAERRIGQLLASAVRPGNPQLSRKVTIGLGRLGITRNQSSRWQIAAKLPEKDFERYLAGKGDLSTTAIVKLAQKPQPPLGAKSGGNILTGDFGRLFDRLEDSSVDLILTDPPYSEIDLYGRLAELAAAKLKPGCLCLAYCGQYHLPDILEAMGRHLHYHWTFAIRFGGPHRAVYQRKIANTWYPVVAFSKGKSQADWITDMLESGGKEKDAHEWQKSLSEVEYIIDKLTTPGALVVDPFCGSGTVPAACKKLGRRWLGCELDSKTARVARGRVAA